MLKEKESGYSIALGVVLVPVAFVINGWCISVLWGWFIVPFGVPPIGIAHAIGISFIAGLLAHKTKVTTGVGSDTPFLHRVIASTMLGPVVLVFAAIPAWFMP